MRRKTITWVSVGAFAVVAGSAGIAAAATSDGSLPSQFTVVSGKIETATGTPKPASGSHASLYSNSSYATTTIDGSGRVVLGAIGDYCEGWPTLRVTVDGNQVGETTIVSATQYGTYPVGAAVGAGRHTVKLAFVNDLYRALRCDRNVHIAFARMENPATSTPSPSATATATSTPAPTATATATATPTSSASTTGFVHPGILVGRAQLDFVKAKVAAGVQPWASAVSQAQSAKADKGTNSGTQFSSLTWRPHPVAYVKCGSYNNPDIGCSDEITDAQAAYTHALLWYYKGDPANAQKAVEILNAWSGTLVDHTFDTTQYANGHLQAAWGAEIFPRAAEIIRYTYTPAAGQTAFDVARFSRMLKTAYLPHVIDGWTGAGANWLMSMAEATMNIGIFTDDRAVFTNGVGDWRAQVPATIFMSTDVNPWPQLAGQPLAPPGTMYDKSTITAAKMKTYWHDPGRYIDGLQGETCRDINHMAMGVGAMLNGAETARIQGVDLYGEQRKRIVAAMELNTGYIAAALNGQNPPPGWVCPNPVDRTNGAWKVTWEIGYNHYANRVGVQLPNTRAFLTNTVRPSGWRTSGFLDYETLTHYGTP